VGDSPLFAISLTGPSGRFTLERMESCVPEMLAVARELTTQFGGEANSGPAAVA
jgi:DNA-binding IclR family transcriptional regulator